MIRWLLILILIPGLFFASGFRIHFENIPAYFESGPSELYRIDTTNGKTIVGQRVKETESEVTLSMAGTTVPFSRSEIAEIRKLTAEEIRQAGEEGLLMEAPKKPVITREKGESIWGKMNFVDNLIKEQEEIGAIVEQNSPRKKQMREMQDAMSKAAQHKREMMQEMQRHDQGY